MVLLQIKTWLLWLNNGNHKITILVHQPYGSCGKTMVMVIDKPKKHGYYTFTIINQWLIFVRGGRMGRML